MAKKVSYESTGIDEYIKQLQGLGESAEEYLKTALYDGTQIVANQIVANINTIPKNKDLSKGLNDEQIRGLKEGFGIAKMKVENGAVTNATGFNGYNSYKTKKYPNGQPNAMIARAIEGGTSWSIKKPFVSPAVNKTKSAVIEAIEKRLETEINKKMKGV